MPADQVDYAPFEATTAGPIEQPAQRPVTAEELSRLHEVPVELAVEVGRTKMTIREGRAAGPRALGPQDAHPGGAPARPRLARAPHPPRGRPRRLAGQRQADRSRRGGRDRRG